MFNCRYAKQNKNLSLYCLLIGQKLTDTHTHTFTQYIFVGWCYFERLDTGRAASLQLVQHGQTLISTKKTKNTGVQHNKPKMIATYLVYTYLRSWAYHSCWWKSIVVSRQRCVLYKLNIHEIKGP